MKKHIGTGLIIGAAGFVVVGLYYADGKTENVSAQNNDVSTKIESPLQTEIQLADNSSHSNEDNTQRVNYLEQDLMEIRQDITQLIKLQQNNSEILASLGNPPQVSSEQNNTPEIRQKLSSEIESEAAEKLVERQYQLQAALSNEEVDLQWINEITQTVQQGFENPELTGINLNNMVCGSTICQLDIQIDESLTSQESLQRLSTNRTWDGETTFSLDRNGKLKLFFAKKGHQLPDDS